MRKRILIIEPSPTLRAILEMELEREEHQVVLFEDYQVAAQALPRFQAAPPDLVFVALRADQPDGHRLVTVLRQQYAQARLVIMMVQEGSSQVAVQRLVEMTQAIVLLKPFRIKDVLALVSNSGESEEQP